MGSTVTANLLEHEEFKYKTKAQIDQYLLKIKKLENYIL